MTDTPLLGSHRASVLSFLPHDPPALDVLDPVSVLIPGYMSTRGVSCSRRDDAAGMTRRHLRRGI